MLGAGTQRIASILKTDNATASEARERFIDNTKGYRELKEGLIRSDASRGFFRGLDGRLVLCESEHLMLAGYLQNGESVVMKYANDRWQQRLRDMSVPFWQVGDVHDEWVTETYEEFAKIVVREQEDSIKWAGELLEVRCPLAGVGAVGPTWYDVH